MLHSCSFCSQCKWTWKKNTILNYLVATDVQPGVRHSFCSVRQCHQVRKHLLKTLRCDHPCRSCQCELQKWKIPHWIISVRKALCEHIRLNKNWRKIIWPVKIRNFPIIPIILFARQVMILKDIAYLIVETDDLVDGESIGMRLLCGRRSGRRCRCSNHPHVLEKVKTDRLIL